MHTYHTFCLRIWSVIADTLGNVCLSTVSWALMPRTGVTGLNTIGKKCITSGSNKISQQKTDLKGYFNVSKNIADNFRRNVRNLLWTNYSKYPWVVLYTRQNYFYGYHYPTTFKSSRCNGMAVCKQLSKQICKFSNFYRFPLNSSVSQRPRHLIFSFREASNMSKRKGPTDDNPNGGIVEFLMGMFHIPV